MALTLMSLAFAIIMGSAYVIRRAYLQQKPKVDEDESLSAQGGHAERIRERYAPSTF